MPMPSARVRIEVAGSDALGGAQPPTDAGREGRR
jgi:hypothetical protein